MLSRTIYRPRQQCERVDIKTKLFHYIAPWTRGYAWDAWRHAVGRASSLCVG